MNKHQEIYSFEHKGITVAVKINYDKRTISLVENNVPENNFEYITKHWYFGDRTIDYMQGWQNILDAMKNAITEATKLLNAEPSPLERILIGGALDEGNNRVNVKSKKK